MKSYLRLTLIFLFSLGIFFFQSSSSLAGLDHNIRGKAYTANNHFIYFNCLDQPTGEFPYEFTFLLGGHPCEIVYTGVGGAEVSDYGVHLDYSNYTFFGYARHEQYGLISFRNGAPGEDYSFVNSCPQTDSTDCHDGNNCSACYNSDSQRVHGWAYVVDDAAWIQLDSPEIAEVDRFGIFNYNDSNAGDFYGLFHYDHEDWGDIDLNCSQSSWPCSPSYKVYVGHLAIATMSAPNWGDSKACDDKALGAVLRWKIHGGNVSSYDIKINDSDNLEGAYQFSLASGEPGFSSDQSTCDSYGFACNLDYGTSYYWWLRLHDDSELTPTSTDWIQFDHGDDPIAGVQGTLTDNQEENDLDKTFTTYKHEWPRPYFSWEGYPEIEFQAGTANRFFVTDSTHYRDINNNIVGFTNPAFIDNFFWRGDPDEKITIVNASILPDIGDLSFHLDASTIIGFEDGERIDQWNDESGNGHHVSQNTAPNRPKYKVNAINGRPAVEFDGNNTNLVNNELTLTQPFTIFAITKSIEKGGDAYILDGIAVDEAALGYSGQNKWMMWAGEALSGGTTNHNLSLWSAYYSGDESFLRIAQGEDLLFTLSGDVGEQNMSGITIGSKYNNDLNWRGYIAEILIYDFDLTVNQRDEVEDYLKKKWEIIDSGDPVDSKVDVYFESIEPDQRIWLELTDPTGYICATSSPLFDVNYELPLWREIKAR